MFFEKCQDLNELKAAYKKLAMEHHPDMGGDVRTMQEINVEYLARLPQADGIELLLRINLDNPEQYHAARLVGESLSPGKQPSAYSISSTTGVALVFYLPAF